MTFPSILIGDIGGTNARFALADPSSPGFSDAMTLPCADYESAHHAIEYFLNAKKAPIPSVVCLAVAGPIIADSIRFTNNHWHLAVDELTASFAGSQVRLLNDFEAIAYSVPHLQTEDLMRVGLPEARPLAGDHFTVGVVGAGTGLGAVGLKSVSGAKIAIAGEAGHMGFAPVTQVQVDLLSILREQYDRVSSERLVCGPGLENIYWALSRLHGKDWPSRSAEEIFTAAGNSEDERASEAVRLFFEVLGQFAGDFALSICAIDGIFIAGGIVPRYRELIANSGFRAGFENKGRCRSMLESTPTHLILHQQPGLLGAAAVAATMAADV